MEEVWVELKEYNKYEISNFGNIRHKIHKKILTQVTHKSGYKDIRFRMGSNKKTFSVHRLVLLNFKSDEYFEKATVNHKDGNKQNNRLDNLEWCTQSHNNKHARETGLHKPPKGSVHGMSILKEHQIPVILRLCQIIKNQSIVGRLFGVGNTTISKIVTGKQWSHINVDCHICPICEDRLNKQK